MARSSASTRTAATTRSAATARSAISSPRRHNLPDNLFKRYVIPDVNQGASGAQLSAGIYHNGVVWATSNFGLYNSLDGGLTWTLKENLNSKYGTAGVEGIFISSANKIYISDLSTGKILENEINPTTNALVNANFTYVKIQDGATDFVYPAPISLAWSGHFNEWSCWEIEQSYEAVGGLSVGDIIFGHYHRFNGDGNAVQNKIIRLAFIYRMRDGKMDAISSTAYNSAGYFIPDPDHDPFKSWNSTQALVRRHIHHGQMGKDGYYYFSTGDYLLKFPIDSVTNVGGLANIACVNHGLITGMTVIIQDASIAGLNGYWTVTKVDLDNVTLNNSNGAVLAGATGGQISPTTVLNDATDTYRYQRIRPDSTGATAFEPITGAQNGFTSMVRLPNTDNTFVLGKDFTLGGVGGNMTIERYQAKTKLGISYSPETRYDWAVWDIALLEDDPAHLFAVVQRMGGNANVGKACASLLESTDSGVTFHRIFESGTTDAESDYTDFDRIYTDRHRYIPTGTKQLILQVQPANSGSYWIYTLDTSTDQTLKAQGNLALWLKADSLSLADGQAVGTWADSSTYGKNATQTTAVSATVAAGGTGYNVNDVLTVVGGTGTAATFTVATVSSGAVATVTLTTAGVYTVMPTNPTVTTVSPAGGAGCTLTITWLAPTYKTNILNGKPIVRFNGTNGSDNQRMLINGTTGVVTKNWMIFAVYNCANIATAGSYNIFMGGEDGIQAGGATAGNVGLYTATGGSKWLRGKTKPTGWQLITGWNRGFWLNGTKQTTFDDYNIMPECTWKELGQRVDAFPATGFGGDIAEIIVYDEWLNDEKRKIVERYLASKYGLTIV